MNEYAATLEAANNNLTDVPLGQPINYDIADGVILTEAKTEIDPEDMMSQFNVGDRFTVTGDPFYAMKRLVITRVDLAGLSTVDKDEVTGNRLSIPTVHCFGWPTVLWYRERGMI